MELRLPELVDLNTYINAERSNRFIAAKLKQRETYKVATLAMQALPRLKRITKITYIWRHKNKRKDHDNVMFATKVINDGLVQAKIIPNDSWAYMPTKYVHKHEINKDDPGVTILIKGDK